MASEVTQRQRAEAVIDAVKAQATIADLQGQVEAAKKKVAGYDRWLSGGVYYTNAEFEEQINDRVNIRNERAALQQRVAQLEDWRDQVTIALQRPGGARFEDVPQHVRDLVADHATLLGLVQAANYELAALFPMPDNPTFENAFAVCGNKNTADARCILNTYEAIHEAASLPAQGGA